MYICICTCISLSTYVYIYIYIRYQSIRNENNRYNPRTSNTRNTTHIQLNHQSSEHIYK